MHLIPEGSEILRSHAPANCPLGSILTGLGILTVLAVEQLTIACVANRHKDVEMRRNYVIIRDEDQESCPSSCKDSCAKHHSEVLSGIEASSNFRDLLALYALELSIAVHSAILGLGYGLETDASTLRALSVAISMHQLVEGIAMGASVAQFRNRNESSFTSCKVLVFMFIFASTISIGVLVGMLVGQSATTRLVQGIFDSLAAGSLLYVCLSEQVSVYFKNPEYDDKALLKVYMLLAMLIGFLVMSALALLE